MAWVRQGVLLLMLKLLELRRLPLACCLWGVATFLVVASLFQLAAPALAIWIELSVPLPHRAD